MLLQRFDSRRYPSSSLSRTNLYGAECHLTPRLQSNIFGFKFNILYLNFRNIAEVPVSGSNKSL